MKPYFKDNNKKLIRDFQKQGLWGDFIIAKRLDPQGFEGYIESMYNKTSIKKVLSTELHWDNSPQKYDFWYKKYKKL